MPQLRLCIRVKLFNILNMKHYETIKSYEDACTYLSIDPNDLPVMSGPEGQRLVAQIKLERITRAINQNKPVLDSYEMHAPYRLLYSREDMRTMLPDSRVKPLNGFLAGLGASSNAGSSAGLAYLYANRRALIAYADWGFRMCFLDREACEYAVEQFAELYDILTFKD